MVSLRFIQRLTPRIPICAALSRIYICGRPAITANLRGGFVRVILLSAIIGGVWSQMPTYHDGNGTSLVLIHTEKGRALWNQIAAHMRYEETPDDALADNPSALKSSALTEQRDRFFARFRQEDFQALIDELCPKPVAPAKPSFLRRCIRKLRSIVKK